MTKLLVLLSLLGSLSVSAASMETIVDTVGIDGPFSINLLADNIQGEDDCSYHTGDNDGEYYSTLGLSADLEGNSAPFYLYFKETESTYENEDGQCEQLVKVYQKAYIRKELSGENFKMNVLVDAKDFDENEDLELHYISTRIE